MSWLHDSRVAPAVLAVDRALAWYIDEVPLATQPPISLAQAEHLREVLAGTRPRASEHFEVVVNFARTMYRVGQLEPSTPQVNLGDMLTAFSWFPSRARPAGSSTPHRRRRLRQAQFRDLGGNRQDPAR
jgi:hypothetical protein